MASLTHRDNLRYSIKSVHRHVPKLINRIPGLRLIVTPPTLKQKTIDIILTTMRDSYKQAIITDPIEPDNAGKASDHKGVIIIP